MAGSFSLLPTPISPRDKRDTPASITVPPSAKTTSATRTNASPGSHHRQSWSQDLRMPASPSQRRPSSISQPPTAFQELWNNPPIAHKGENRFENRDWKTVRVGEIVDQTEVHFAEPETSVEDATNLLVSAGAPNVVLVRQNHDSRTVIQTFDYSDLNAYLLLVIGLAQPEQSQLQTYDELARKSREGQAIPLGDIREIGNKEPILTLPHTAYLTDAVEKFGSGVHRILIVREGTTDVGGVLTQLRLVRFFWENARNFPAIHELHTSNLSELKLGSRNVIAINGDKLLADALTLMHEQSITSLPVLDNHNNVVGNISHVDTKLLTTSTSLPLLKSSCIHFISVILSERGVNDGKDSYPVFYVSPYSTLAHTVAKLVATRSHRMWMVDAPSPSSATPQVQPTAVPAPLPTFSSISAPSVAAPLHIALAGNAVPAASMPGQHMSGKICGVISLTDVLNLFAKVSGLKPQSPDDARRQRRGSSSSSMRASIDSARSSEVDLSRSASISGPRR